MTYSIEHKEEALRLEEQSQILQYSIEKELSFFDLHGLRNILDIGCGSGLLSRFIDKNYSAQVTGLDGSEIRVQQAKNLTDKSSNIKFIFENILTHNTNSSYDGVFLRFVLQHCPEPVKIMKKAYDLLEAGGKIHIIELDNFFLDIYTQNTKLNHYLRILKKSFPVDFYIGKKIPSLLEKAKFKNIDFNVEAMLFKEDSLLLERKNNIMRIDQAYPALLKILDSEVNVIEFKELYIEEMMKETVPIFYNKVMVSAQR